MNRPPQHEPVAISREKCLRLRAIRNTPKPSMLTPTRSCLPRKFAPGKSHSQRGTRYLDPLPAYSPKNTKTVPTVIRPILKGLPARPVRLSAREPHDKEAGQAQEVEAGDDFLGEHCLRSRPFTSW